jgi:pSer/pThr/pTyr-binding forkhead associated (FHA) protein
MRANCPKCGASLHLTEKELVTERPVPVRCWMCTSMVSLDVQPADSGPPTIAAKSPRKSKASIMVRLKAQTTALALPPDKIITMSVIAGPSQGTEYELFRPLMTIGRVGGSADIKLDDPEVSGLHCAIEVRRDVVLLHDLNSRNGTYMDNSRVVAALLEPTSQFRIGSSILQVSLTSKTNETPELPPN